MTEYVVLTAIQQFRTRYVVPVEDMEDCDPETFIKDEELINWVDEDIKQLSNELAKFERIKHFKLKRNPFTIEEGEITPTLKAKRKVIEQKYADAISSMYTEDES